MTKTYKAEEIQELAQTIMKHKRLYYAGSPEIPDAAFDRLEAKLKGMSPHHPVLEFVGSDQEIPAADKVVHGEPMLSLQKVYELEDLFDWIDGQEVVGTYKVDGNSVSLVYEMGRLVMAKTRGNGRMGENIIEKAHWVADVVPQVKDDLNFEIRGELYCSADQFRKLCEEMKTLGLDEPSNPRNIVAGVLGRKTHYSLSRYFNFLAFDLLTDQPFDLEMTKFDWLRQRGFATPGETLLSDRGQVLKYLDEVKKVMDEGAIGLDGAVFVLNDVQAQKAQGNTSHHPRYKMSFKWQGQTAEALIDHIYWGTSRQGNVTPVAVIEAVELSGAQITNVTLHNALHVRDHNLKKGDRIEIVRSGEVIPKFLQVNHAASGNYEWPDQCPSCSSSLEFDGVRLKCPNTEGCPAQKIGSILNWIRCVEIDDLSEKRLENMLELGLVQDIPDLYKLKEDDFLKLPLTKEKMAKKLYANIQASCDIPLARFMSGLGIQSMGLTSWEKLLSVAGSLDGLLKYSASDIEMVDGFAEKTAIQVEDSLVEKRPLIDALLEAGVKPRPPEIASQSAPSALTGKQVAITGKLSRPRNEIAAIIKQAGGKVASSVSKNTFAVVTEDATATSSKLKKARELGIPIWSEDQLISQLEGET